MTWDPYSYLPAHGSKGLWTVFIKPITSRRMEFQILRRSSTMEVVKEYAVKFELYEFEEGEWPKEPTIAGIYENDDVRDFLQAIVDCAQDLGITPTKQEDHTLELAAVRAHLEDMRSLVLRMPIGLFAKPQTGNGDGNA